MNNLIKRITGSSANKPTIIVEFYEDGISLLYSDEDVIVITRKQYNEFIKNKIKLKKIEKLLDKLNKV